MDHALRGSRMHAMRYSDVTVSQQPARARGKVLGRLNGGSANAWCLIYMSSNGYSTKSGGSMWEEEFCFFTYQLVEGFYFNFVPKHETRRRVH